jgi:hypothetical protein
MQRRVWAVLLACTVLLDHAPAIARPEKFSFGVISSGLTKTSDDSALRTAISQSDADNLAFVVANGIKSAAEPCTDQMYNRRKTLFDQAKNGLVPVLAANDWAKCKRNDGRSAAIERLNRVRELFFVGEFSLGNTRIPLVRQSLTPKFHGYGENARWVVGDVLFATINLPANNNHYLSAAGRNSEFEDRLVANRAWLQKLYHIATWKGMKAIVLFSDGNPLSNARAESRFKLYRSRDGFAETRRQIAAVATKFSGKVLVIHDQNKSAQPPLTDIVWHKNVGHLDVPPGWTKITVDRSLLTLFSIADPHAAPGKPAQ